MYAIQRGTTAEADIDTADGGIPRSCLMGMCRTGVVPREFHDFYVSLFSSGSAPDKLG